MPPLDKIEKFTEGWVSTNIINNFNLDNSAATDIKNVEYHPRGAISKREGYKSYTMSGTPITGVMKLYPWEDFNGNHTTFAFTTASGSTISAGVYSLAMTAGSTTALCAKTLLTAGGTWQNTWWTPNITADEIHVDSYAQSAIAVYGGSGPPLVLSSSIASAVPATAWYISGAKYLTSWGNYLFLGNFLDTAAGGSRTRSRIQWNLGLGSVWAGAVSWPADYYLDLDPDDGDEITGMCLLKEFLVVFKRRKVFLVWYTGDATMFTYRRQVSDIGCIAGNSIIQRGEYLYFLSDDGFYRFDGEGASEISNKIKDKIVDYVNHSLTSVVHAGLYNPHRQVWFSVNYSSFDTAAETDNYKRQANAIFVYDYEIKNWTLYDIKASALGNCVLDTDNNLEDLILGHYAQTDTTRKSCISKFGHAETSDIYQTAISSYWISKWLDVQDPQRNKRLLRTTIFADQEGTETDTYSLTWEMREDWKVHTFSGVNTNATSGTIYLTGSSTTLSGEVSQTYRTGNPMEIRIDMSHTVRAWQLKISNATSGHPWTIHKVLFDGMPKGRTKVT